MRPPPAVRSGTLASWTTGTGPARPGGGAGAPAHDAGVRSIVWTVNDPDTMHRLLDHGVEGIITDRPDLLREVLIARAAAYADRAGARPEWVARVTSGLNSGQFPMWRQTP